MIGPPAKYPTPPTTNGTPDPALKFSPAIMSPIDPASASRICQPYHSEDCFADVRASTGSGTRGASFFSHSLQSSSVGCVRVGTGAGLACAVGVTPLGEASEGGGSASAGVAAKMTNNVPRREESVQCMPALSASG